MMAIVKNQAVLKTTEKGKTDNQSKVWHNRLGHVKSASTIQKLVRNNLLPHAKCSIKTCEEFIKLKYRQRSSGSLTSSKQVGRLRVDTNRKVDTPSSIVHLHFLTIIV